MKPSEGPGDIDPDHLAGPDQLSSGRIAAALLPVGGHVAAVLQPPREGDLAPASPQGPEKLRGDGLHRQIQFIPKHYPDSALKVGNIAQDLCT